MKSESTGFQAKSFTSRFHNNALSLKDGSCVPITSDYENRWDLEVAGASKSQTPVDEAVSRSNSGDVRSFDEGITIMRARGIVEDTHKGAWVFIDGRELPIRLNEVVCRYHCIPGDKHGRLVGVSEHNPNSRVWVAEGFPIS